jgi:hypothetical protein
MTTEQTNLTGEPITVDWEFDSIVERHDSDWCEWSLIGIGSDGSSWAGSTQAFGSNPEFGEEITDKEQI